MSRRQATGTGSQVREDDGRIQQQSFWSGGQTYLFMFSCWLISFAYMLPWTACGSLISYYKITYSARFYVEIYSAYYLFGLPIALIQYYYDDWFDLRYGSKVTFLTRGVVGYSILLGVQYSLIWIDSTTIMIILFSLLGLASWWLHGTASIMVSLFPNPNLIAFLQIGFRSPELYTLIADIVLSLGAYASTADIDLLFEMNCVIIGFGLINWIIIIHTELAKQYFDEKNERMKLLHSKDITSYQSIEDLQAIDESSALLGDETKASPPLTACNGSTLEETPSTSDNCCGKCWDGTTNCMSRMTYKMLHYIFLGKDKANNHDEKVFNSVFPLCCTLMLTIWSSIFQAAFYAYVDSKNGWDIEQILYFTRLLSDLVGRPLTFLPRPSFMQVW